ncbi:MAG: hypothetical protein MPW16_16255 [Candidatus Manganitrophus sp.]|nr:MAG: hypothetical protein MPW16_16255 [Candidatus Manganitrophus sp.]
MLAKTSATFRASASSRVRPQSFTSGLPAGLLIVSISRHRVPIRSPVPSALRIASFTANRAERWTWGAFR